MQRLGWYLYIDYLVGSDGSAFLFWEWSLWRRINILDHIVLCFNLPHGSDHNHFICLNVTSVCCGSLVKETSIPFISYKMTCFRKLKMKFKSFEYLESPRYISIHYLDIIPHQCICFQCKLCLLVHESVETKLWPQCGLFVRWASIIERILIFRCHNRNRSSRLFRF